MKINICFPLKEGPWGGGNQFLQALKRNFKGLGIYEENLEKAEIILFNSYPFNREYLFNEIFQIKRKYPHKIIIYRIDGPISLIRDNDKEVDQIIRLFNNLFVDGIIFQSNWCKEQNEKFFKIFSKYETIIYNAPDNHIFNIIDKTKFDIKEKIKLISTSWSANWNKGFEIYKWLDEHLDLSKYKMTFVGNTPIEFKNIKHIKAVSSKELAKILKQHDIFITASRNDPCSNSLIEALSCGLPAVVYNDGGHPELVQEGGELFKEKYDVMTKIEKVSQNYNHYKSKIPKFSIKEVAQQYYKFAQDIYNDTQSKKYKPKQVNFLTKINFYKMKVIILKWKIKNKLKKIFKI